MEEKDIFKWRLNLRVKKNNVCYSKVHFDQSQEMAVMPIEKEIDEDEGKI